MQHPLAKHRQHGQDQSSDRFSHPSQRREHLHPGLHSCGIYTDSAPVSGSFPGLPVSTVIPFVSADSTDEETCDLLMGFLTRWVIFWNIWLIFLGRCSFPSCLCHFGFRIGPSRGLGNLRLPSSFLFDSPLSCGHTRRTRNSYHVTSLTCLLCLFVCRLSCLRLVLPSASTSMGDAPGPCPRLLVRISRSSVSVSQENLWIRLA